MLLAFCPRQLPAQTDDGRIEPVHTSITVTEKIAAETPGQVSSLSRGELRQEPGANLDDRLRAVPGFTLFRRSSSVVAHPTTQGVSLRGLGSSGASRTLVLCDGIPLNDPFGGWVYWTRVPPDEIAEVEITRGASTSVFGDRAMGGTIALFSREPERMRALGRYEGGNRATQDVSGGLSNLWTRWAASANVRAFTTDGYFIVPAEIRGPVDRRANVRFATGDARLDYLGAADRLWLKFDALGEDRGNGTVLQRNSTGLGALSAHYTHAAGADAVSVLGWHTREEFHGTFSAIAADRASERLTSTQTVPAESTGGAAFWRHDQKAIRWIAGADATRVEGYSKDALYPTGRRVAGGTRLEHGVFAQTDFAAGPARLFVGARHDFTGGGDTFFSPSAGVTAGRGPLRVRGSVYRGFRAPTLNELFREFRTGNTVTQANPALRPEKLFGGEAGADYSGESLRASVTFFRDSLSGLITNVTLSAAPNLIVRQRQNAAAAVSRGGGVDLEKRWGALTATAAYLFLDSRFAGGARVPQVPRHQGSARLSWLHGGTLAAIGVRSYGSQFEDERNLRSMLLPGFASVQFVVAQRIAAKLSALADVEDALDRRWLVGFTPTPAIGPPRLWRVGLRWGI